MKPEDIKGRAEELANKMNTITASFSENKELIEGMDVHGDELMCLVDNVLDKSDTEVDAVRCESGLVTQAEALNLEMLVEDFKYVRTTLKTNADAGRRIIANLTLSILDFDDETELADKALLVSAFADINKSVAVNMDLYLKTYKEISTILVQLDKIKDTENSLNSEPKGNKTEKEVNTLDLIKELNIIKE